MKTNEEIKQCIYDLIQYSGLMVSVNGGLYKHGKRPANSNKEDVVIALLANNLSEVQEAYINVNVYFKDIARDIRNDDIVGKEYEIDGKRATQLSRLFMDALERNVFQGALIVMSEQTIIEAEREHFINNKLLFRFNNE